MVPDEGLEAQIQEETGLCHKLFRGGGPEPRVSTPNPMLMLTRQLQCNTRRLAEGGKSTPCISKLKMGGRQVPLSEECVPALVPSFPGEM